MWVYRQDEHAAANPLGGYRGIISVDQAFANATGGTPAAITGFSFPIKNGQVWAVEVFALTGGVSGGGKFSVSGPASPTLVSLTAFGLTSGVTAYSTDTVTALDTLGGAYNTSAVTGPVLLRCLFVATADGTVQFNCANVTNSNSFAVKAGSFFVAIRIA